MTAILYDLIERSKDNNAEALMEIINRFQPLLKKLSRGLKYEYAETDLTISLIEIIRNINMDKLKSKNDQVIVSLLCKSLNNKRIDLFRKHVLNHKEEYELDPGITQDKAYEDNETRLMLRVTLDSLTYIQKYILISKYYKGYSEAKIAEQLNISRQAVNRAKNRALAKLRSLIII